MEAKLIPHVLPNEVVIIISIQNSLASSSFGAKGFATRESEPFRICPDLHQFCLEDEGGSHDAPKDVENAKAPTGLFQILEIVVGRVAENNEAKLAEYREITTLRKELSALRDDIRALSRRPPELCSMIQLGARP
jgi:hypothetical protein